MENATKTTDSKRQTYMISEKNIEVLRCWSYHTREGYSAIINRLIEENCPTEYMIEAENNLKDDKNKREKE